ncbi:hypothetical protein DFJ73DRAFT_861445 [Zopfochytrium polystomum]|nr:hypothetical protein DFJ73DRAFT_861445 [Zopfochytrium polystomum]
MLMRKGQISLYATKESILSSTARQHLATTMDEDATTAFTRPRTLPEANEDTVEERDTLPSMSPRRNSAVNGSSSSSVNSSSKPSLFRRLFSRFSTGAPNASGTERSSPEPTALNGELDHRRGSVASTSSTSSSSLADDAIVESTRSAPPAFVLAPTSAPNVPREEETSVSSATQAAQPAGASTDPQQDVSHTLVPALEETLDEAFVDALDTVAVADTLADPIGSEIPSSTPTLEETTAKGEKELPSLSALNTPQVETVVLVEETRLTGGYALVPNAIEPGASSTVHDKSVTQPAADTPITEQLPPPQSHVSTPPSPHPQTSSPEASASVAPLAPLGFGWGLLRPETRALDDMYRVPHTRVSETGYGFGAVPAIVGAIEA